jgi:hypothetical protein
VLNTGSCCQHPVLRVHTHTHMHTVALNTCTQSDRLWGSDVLLAGTTLGVGQIQVVSLVSGLYQKNLPVRDETCCCHGCGSFGSSCPCDCHAR